MSAIENGFSKSANSQFRPIPAGLYWPLHGDEFGRMKFGGVPTDA